MSNLDELLENEARKRFYRIKSLLRNCSEGELSQDFEGLFIDLHSLKGDFAYLDSPEAMELLEKLRLQCEEVFQAQLSSEAALISLERLESFFFSRSVGQGEEEGKFGKIKEEEKLEDRLRKLIASVAKGLGRNIDLNFQLNWDHCELAPSESAFLLYIINPLLVNACVYGVVDKGEVLVRIARKEQTLNISVEDFSPHKSQSDVQNHMKKNTNNGERLYSGQGLGLKSLKEFLLSKNAKMQAGFKPEGGYRVVIAVESKRSFL